MTENDHREEALDEYFENLSHKTFVTYRFLVVVGVILVIYNYGWLWGAGFYLGTLLFFPVVVGAVGAIAGLMMSNEKLNRLTRAYHIKQVHELIDKLGIDPTDLAEEVKSFDQPQAPPVQATVSPSESIIGRFMDQPIHEWVDVNINGDVRRFLFDAPAQKKNGEYALADGDCVLYNGLIYLAQPCSSPTPSMATPTSQVQ